MIAVSLLLACFNATALAATQLPKSLLSAGGQRASSGNVTVSGNLGDVLSGISMAPGGGTIAEHGFWAGNVQQLLDVLAEPRVSVVEYLGPARPNPVQTNASVEFGLAREGQVSLVVYDPAGRLVRQLVSGTKSAGVHRVDWDLRTDEGSRVPAGIYFTRLLTGAATRVRKLVVLD